MANKFIRKKYHNKQISSYNMLSKNGRITKIYGLKYDEKHSIIEHVVNNCTNNNKKISKI